MTDLLPPWPLLSAFLLASLALAVTPGPGVFYIVGRSLAQGRRAGLVSALAVALGNLGNAWAASLGLAALFAVSGLAFDGVRLAGALYLIYLGVRALRAPSAGLAEAATGASSGLGGVFRDGVVVALLNPKTTLFFAAFLPQFMGGGAPMAQGMALGAVFTAIAAVTDSAYALAAGGVAPWLARAGTARALGRYLGAGAFIGLGLLAALAGGRGGR